MTATAQANDLVIVTRNVADFQGRDVTILDPFKKPAKSVPLEMWHEEHRVTDPWRAGWAASWIPRIARRGELSAPASPGEA